MGEGLAEQTEQLNHLSKVLQITSDQASARTTELLDSGLGDPGSALPFGLGPRVTCSPQLPFFWAPTPTLLWNILSTQVQAHGQDRVVITSVSQAIQPSLQARI